MQHIVNIAFDFDDETVRSRIEENVEARVVRIIADNIENAMFRKDGFGLSYESNKKATYREFMKNQMNKFLEDHKAEILDIAGSDLAERLSRTKAAREIVKELKDG